MAKLKPKNQQINNWLLLLAVVVLAVSPLILVKDGKFGGSDDQAKAKINEIQPDYKPWFKSLVELPSAEVQSLLFSVQAAAGAGVIGYVIGLYKGRSEQRNQHNENSD
ncbi:energy-coupling factor ABC transporter substrate-binding protein [Aetokthonos hydrillicola Thurmond2011]|jgi:cobalt/nickel transport protein|uniref:Cobalt transport protein CbiN n=1 Tax=Aetokthonos hydrillicola Thurmond2011 TaxID=2712845 RepID=A0AAP5MAK0_9CYAN|nr:energy-coupling factor ABC transporter substrate-binding protein [Aetokthonos hydrillicola]MBO3463435.1 energy-coupling factor ABC transporter substrate-binding protein [Aetokthonos hydrillicola CCALA 1050]MBW4590404.1 energy-coupling factor ABC transporter substrate-binding protein [Aetokthonos hydrillicola CCALA 1050]MDR9898205.1 energy-coupling factor ABC transporter substrate-binding protein [Aetokthonos hydrillicola Thurmond2011]